MGGGKARACMQRRHVPSCWHCWHRQQQSVPPAGAAAHQYSRRMGQKTGTSNMGKKVAVKPISSALRLLHLRQWSKRDARRTRLGGASRQRRPTGGAPGLPACRRASLGHCRRSRAGWAVRGPPRRWRAAALAGHGLCQATPPGQAGAALRAGGSTGAPELELWQAPHKGAELLVRLAGQGGPIQLRVDLGAAQAGTHRLARVSGAGPGLVWGRAELWVGLGMRPARRDGHQAVGQYMERWSPGPRARA